ncbi:septal ring lytic transglycosylase RlpA family protein [Massilia sp. TS11]|uniref:septal ring lytic transglycosylase RlpA family protein n=1 Tax=Massilia sp. TS11 TaxID=2908003 RepID=UPI001EDC16DF|nr:septal ring lytic transglycosylase RlpA family protein [Massilia sp. TS11]MCG2585481.1 septal ring lytic transglycosylase RlpA family protein [Massilia sp. TS11]
MRMFRSAASLCALASLLAACASVPTPAPRSPAPAPTPAARTPAVTPANVPSQDPATPTLPAANSGRGGYYKDDGPGENPPPNLVDMPDADVKLEPLNPRTNRPYVIFGKTYTPLGEYDPYVQEGVGSWYGKKFHGQRTSSGEPYDMYKMTAAHPLLPIPSYIRVTSLESGKTVVVRVNDRGPFHAERIIDLSYTAALKLGILGKGSHKVRIERILPDEIRRIVAARSGGAKPPPEVERLMLEDKVVDMAAAAVPRITTSAFYLQLGAYGKVENAQAAKRRFERHGGALSNVEMVANGSMQRLYAGPFATREEAQQAADALPPSLGVKPIVIQR